MDITAHAEKRIRKRLGIPRKAVERFVKEAHQSGIPAKQFKGRVKKFYDAVSIKYQAGNQSFFYREYVFIAQDNVLITVYPVPRHLNTNKD